MSGLITDGEKNGASSDRNIEVIDLAQLSMQVRARLHRASASTQS